MQAGYTIMNDDYTMTISGEKPIPVVSTALNYFTKACEMSSVDGCKAKKYLTKYMKEQE